MNNQKINRIAMLKGQLFSIFGAIKKKQKLSFFTLAEVLIVVGIIGLVAELTIPTLMQNVQDAALKTAWKKEYSAFS